jgi:hypothetical protein
VKRRNRARASIPARPALPGRAGIPLPTVPPRARSAACEAIRQKLRPPLMYDEDKIDRMVAFERQRAAGATTAATEEQLHAAAYERWVQENR